MTDPHAGPGFGRTLGLMAVFFVLGTPLVALVWHNLNDLLAGHVHPAGLALAAVAALLLWGVLRLLSRSARSLDASRARETGRHTPPSHGGAPHA